MHILLSSFVLVFSASVALTQAPSAPSGDASRYAVAYVEVMSSKAAAFTDAFRKYRDASRSEPGYGAVEMFGQSDRPGHFVVLETWKDQASIEAHAKSAAVTQFRAALDPIRVSGYDERPYKTLNARGASSGSGRGGLHVVTHVDFAPGSGDGIALLNRLADASRSDAGCLRFDVMQHAWRANHFTIVESWASAQARAAHAAAANTRKYRDDVQPMTGSPLDERMFKASE
jgi:quinol monooxygenase YgiN